MSSKKKFDDVLSGLDEQAKERFSAVPNKNVEISNDSDNNIQNKSFGRPKKNKFPKLQKTVYLDDIVVKLLKKASYKYDCDQSEIVNRALNQFFESEEITLNEAD